MIPLPYADDIRDNKSIISYAGFDKKENERGIVESLTREEMHAAKLLVKNLNIEFDSRNFEKPGLQKFFSGLQALALNEDEPEPIEDLLEPDYEGLKKFDAVLGKFRDTFYHGRPEDPECAEKPKPPNSRGAGRGRGRGGAGAKAAVSGGLSDRKIVNLSSSQS